MDAPKRKVDLIATMEAARSDWEGALAQVGQDRMTLPALHGGWSVKDTIGHVAYYERWLQSWLEAAVRGKVTAASHRDVLEVDARNALIWDENKARTLTDILDESRGVYERLLQLVKLLSEQDLFAQHAYDRYVLPFWNTSQPLWECIYGDSYGHYGEHADNIRRWLAAEKRVLEAIRDGGEG
jgi:hypothetical protein